MKKYDIADQGDTYLSECDDGEFYRVSDVNARIAQLEHELDIRKAAVEAQFRLMERVKELEAALREAMEWNWLDEDSPPPREVIGQCNSALMERS
jgi:hypothetical protein